MTTSERAALLRALEGHPQVTARYPQFWRVKRMEPEALRALASSVGVNVAAIQGTVRAALPRKAEPPPEKPQAPFKGTFGFTLNIEAFGLNTPSRARVVWEYTPEWFYYPPTGNLRIDGQEDCTFTVEVETVTQEEPFEFSDGSAGEVEVLEWQPLLLWGSGLVGEDVMDHIFSRIDEAARAQNRARKRLANSSATTSTGRGRHLRSGGRPPKVEAK